MGTAPELTKAHDNAEATAFYDPHEQDSQGAQLITAPPDCLPR